MGTLAEVHRHLTTAHGHCVDAASAVAREVADRACHKEERRLTPAVAKGSLLSWSCTRSPNGPCLSCGWPATLTVERAAGRTAVTADSSFARDDSKSLDGVGIEACGCHVTHERDGEDTDSPVLEARAATGDDAHCEGDNDDDDDSSGVILLWYHYCHVPSAADVARSLHEVCTELGLVGKVRVASEGLNGSVSGTRSATRHFVDVVLAMQPFAASMRRSNFLRSVGPAQSFDGLEVVVVPEIITLGIKPAALPASAAAGRLSPSEFHSAAMEAIADPHGGTVLLDVRNFFESRIGRFDNAVCPDVRKFSYFPGYLEANADLFRDKRVLMCVMLAPAHSAARVLSSNA